MAAAAFASTIRSRGSLPKGADAFPSQPRNGNTPNTHVWTARASQDPGLKRTTKLYSLHDTRFYPACAEQNSPKLRGRVHGTQSKSLGELGLSAFSTIRTTRKLYGCIETICRSQMLQHRALGKPPFCLAKLYRWKNTAVSGSVASVFCVSCLQLLPQSGLFVVQSLGTRRILS